MRILEIVASVVILSLALFDIFQTVVLPRPSIHNRRLISTWFLRAIWRVWRWVGTRGTRQDARENFLAVFGPLALILQLLVWSLLLVLGFAFLLLAVGDELRPSANNFGDALYFSATTLVPLSYGDRLPVGIAARIFTIGESATGVGLAALVISLLFTLYGSFQQRERTVVKLDALAGAPPSGVRILEVAAKYRKPELLPQTFDEWSDWISAVLESHLAYPILVFFRSSHDNEAWLNSFGSVMDAASLVTSAVEDGSIASARLMLKIGMHLAEDLSWYFRLDKTQYVGIEREEFDEALRSLQHSGYTLRAPDLAWSEFSALRSQYASPLNQLARRLAIQPAQWIGDRSYLPHQRWDPVTTRRRLRGIGGLTPPSAGGQA